MEQLANGMQSRQIDHDAIETVKIPGMVLMERAAAAVAESIRREISMEKRILILCGTGNNGGDGVAAGRILEAAGYQVEIFMTGAREKSSGQLKEQITIAENIGLSLSWWEDGNYQESVAYDKVKECEIILDGIFGVGLSRAVGGRFFGLIRTINESGKIVYSIDIPSGLDADTGNVLGIAVSAKKTITMGVNKKGLVLYPGCDYAGEVEVAEIGFPECSVHRAEISWYQAEKRDLKELPERKRNSHKGTYGHVLVIAGSRQMSGAAYLSALAAYRMGAGLVKVITEVHSEQVIRQLLPEALLESYREEEEIQEGWIKEQLEWADAVVIGPGLSKSEAAKQLVSFCFSYVTCPFVLDADGINIVAEDEKLKQMAYEKEQLVMTPHLKELARFLGISVTDVKENLSKVEQLLSGYKGILVAKDAKSLVVQEEKVCVSPFGSNAMATGGSGDVLTGILAGIYAQRKEYSKELLFKDTVAGVGIHGRCGEAAAEKLGVRAVMARDIANAAADVINTTF